ncbi:hypothetical protein D9619_001941 [Psilocybe cf. subviscida]|uniref:BTB domain-containing protein n=1 Tax=Psilocybe cf. subviscida TaxID=2480587 RepID=A0A8H5BDP2_9AGAR|nr:hypothetical protein D9619_001941 [Psilocybe cf. subviscida]
MSSTQQSENAEGISRSPTFWCQDGNIILKTADGTHYRIHKGLLSMGSIVFRHMFEDAVASADEELDRCAVVQFQDEKSDLEMLLSSLYMPDKKHPSLPNLAVDDLLSMLHMYRKYQYDGLLELALRRLNIEFPTNFAQFKQRYQTHIRVCIDAGELKGKCGLMCTPCWVLPGMPNLFPQGESLCSLRLEILDGWRSSNNREMTFKFHQVAQRALIMGQEKLRQTIFSNGCPRINYSGGKIFTATSCLTREACAETWMNRFDRLVLSYHRDSNPYLYAYLFPKLSKPAQAVYDLPCKDCILVLNDRYDREEEEAFDTLPYMFGLQGWHFVLSE